MAIPQVERLAYPGKVAGEPALGDATLFALQVTERDRQVVVGMEPIATDAQHLFDPVRAQIVSLAAVGEALRSASCATVWPTRGGRERLRAVA